MTDREIMRRYGHLLKPKQREAIDYMRRGFSQREIALALGLSRSGVVARIESGLLVLKRAIEAEEASCEHSVEDQAHAGGGTDGEVDGATGAGDGRERAAPVGRRRAKQAASRDPGDREERERRDSRDAA